jgi:hypothetical protein
MTTATGTAGRNLRTGPGTQFLVMEVLPPPTVGEVLAQQDDWINGRAQDFTIFATLYNSLGQAAHKGSWLHGVCDAGQRRPPA